MVSRRRIRPAVDAVAAWGTDGRAQDTFHALVDGPVASIAVVDGAGARRSICV